MSLGASSRLMFFVSISLAWCSTVVWAQNADMNTNTSWPKRTDAYGDIISRTDSTPTLNDVPQAALTSDTLEVDAAISANSVRRVCQDGTPVTETTGSVWYVARESSGTGNGTTWDGAFNTIQPAIDAAFAAGGGEVWVTRGVYDEVRLTLSGALSMAPGVQVYGGFIGTETARDERDWEANATRIDGSQARAGSSAYHVVVGAEDAMLDGFEITGGRAVGAGDDDQVGGGMLIKNASMTVARCTFFVNVGGWGGGLAIVTSASPTIERCIFENNQGTVNGGGVHVWDQCAPLFRDCIFTNNSAERMGGALLEGGDSASTIFGCYFNLNFARNLGGAIGEYEGGASRIVNCVFVGNTVQSDQWGGGGLGCWQSAPIVINCTFSMNSSPFGAGIYQDGPPAPMRVINSILWEDVGGELNGSFDITYCNVQGGAQGEGNLSPPENPLFVDPENGDFRLAANSPCIDRGTLSEAPTVDIIGTPRPQDQGIDMGAYEYAPGQEGEGEGEGEGEEPPLTPWVTVAITEANDLCRVYLNGELAVETAWGEGPGGIEIGDEPGYSGEVDITQALRVGNNTFRFVVWNAEGCCAVSGFFQVKVNGVTVYNNGIERADSTEGVKFFDTYSLLWDLTKADLIVEAQDAVTQARLPFAVVRVDPGGHTARLADNGLHRFLLDRPGAYTATAFAAGYEPETAPPLVFGADSVYATVVFFMTPQAGGSPDSDGDGLPDWDEINLHGTNPDNPDTDGDGMSDLFEVQYGLDPTLDDAHEDLDGDGFTNLREFFLRSDPTDPSDPRADFYVSLAGNNANAGTRDAPWRTLQYAIDAVGELVGDAVGRAEPARLRLLADGTLASVIAEAGTYQEDVALRPGIRVEGASLGQTIIQGRVTGAPHSALVRVRVQEPAAGATPLVRVSNSAMLLDRVTLRGRTSSLATGVLFEGEDTGGTLMTDCVLVQLRTGLDIHGAVPLVRRTRFSDISGDAIVLRAISAKQGEENTLGTANDSGSGWNRFENIGGKVVVNERGTEIRVEDNDWDTDDPAEIAELVEGPVDYEPFLPKGGGLLPASIICAVWEAATNMPVTNAALSIAPGGITPVTDNVDGVYVFAALPAGTYTVTVNAPGFDAMGTATTVSGGQTASLVFALGAEKAQPPPDGCGCFKAADASGPALSAQAGNVLVLVLAVAAALSRRRRAARASRP